MRRRATRPTRRPARRARRRTRTAPSRDDGYSRRLRWRGVILCCADVIIVTPGEELGLRPVPARDAWRRRAELPRRAEPRERRPRRRQGALARARGEDARDIIRVGRLRHDGVMAVRAVWRHEKKGARRRRADLAARRVQGRAAGPVAARDLARRRRRSVDARCLFWDTPAHQRATSSPCVMFPWTPNRCCTTTTRLCHPPLFRSPSLEATHNEGLPLVTTESNGHMTPSLEAIHNEGLPLATTESNGHMTPSLEASSTAATR